VSEVPAVPGDTIVHVPCCVPPSPMSPFQFVTAMMPVEVDSVPLFNAQVTTHPDVVVLNISADTPFAAKRFCEAHKIDQVITLSEFRTRDFGKDYGVEFKTGPLAGILSRSVVVIGKDNKVIHTEQVAETANEPNYEAVWKALA